MGGRKKNRLPTAYCLLPSSQFKIVFEEASVFCRPGDDLLSRVLRQSTIGAEAFDGRVRDGIGSDRLAESHQAGKGRIRRTEDGEQRTEGRSVLCRLHSVV